jgi:hypothetical protein
MVSWNPFARKSQSQSQSPEEESSPSSSYKTTSGNSKEVNEKIARDLNPAGGSGSTSSDSAIHNYGKPQKAPIDTQTASKDVAKFLTDCKKQHQESLKCIERNYSNRAACEPFFAAYKACRREENERRLDANAGKSWF